MFEKVCAILANFTKVDPSQMTMETDLLNDLEMNSLDTMDAVIRFEEAFDIEIPDRDVPKFHTIKDIVQYIADELSING